jgi:hypothetical protein
MKRLLLLILVLFCIAKAHGQVTNLAGDYKLVDIGGNQYGDYTRSLILLHEIYNGTLIEHNYCIGTITAMRGTSAAGDRINVANVNTSSSYLHISGAITSMDRDNVWELKTCMYKGKKYLAADVPYAPSYHNWGFKFGGATSSTAESLKCVSYLVNNQPVNQDVLSDIQKFNSNLLETHDVAVMSITGNVGIGVIDTKGYKLGVNGGIHAQQVTVDMNNWADHVFRNDYELLSLTELEKYLVQHQHLPEIPSAVDVSKKGVDLGEMNKLLLKKIEELTLHLIAKDKELKSQEDRLVQIEKLLKLNN